MTLRDRLDEGAPLRLGELAQALGYSREMMRKWANSGIVKTERAHPRAHRRVPVAEAERLARELRVNPETQQLQA